MKQAVRVSEAQQIVLAHVSPIGIETIPLVDALQRVIAETVTSPRYIPLDDNSAMDGYAVQHRDIEGANADQPAILDVVDILPAGKTPQRQVEAGQSIKIFILT